MDIVVRPAVADDLPALLPLLRGYSTSTRPARTRAPCWPWRAPSALTRTGRAGSCWRRPTPASCRLRHCPVELGHHDRNTPRGDGGPVRARGRPAGEGSAGSSSTPARPRPGRGCAALTWETAPDNERAQRLYDRRRASTWLAYRLPSPGEPAEAEPPVPRRPRGIRCPPCRVHSSSRPTSRSRPSSASRCRTRRCCGCTSGRRARHQGRDRLPGPDPLRPREVRDDGQAPQEGRDRRGRLPDERVRRGRRVLRGGGRLRLSHRAHGATRCRSTRATCWRSTPRSTGTSSACRAQA